MKLILTTILLTLSLFTQQPQQTTPKYGVTLERETAQAIWDDGTGSSKETFEAIILALRNARPLEAQAQNEARCLRHDFGDGASDECLRKLVILALPRSVVEEWLEVLTTDGKKLSPEAGREIVEAFCSAGFGEGCSRLPLL